QNDDYYDVFTIECQHPEQSDSVHKTYLIEQDAHNVSIESVDMNYDSEQNDEDVDLAKERELLASLIQKLKCEIDETKNRNTLLETSNKVLVEKLKSEIADFKKKNKSLTEANNKLSEENDLLYADFKKSKAELKRCDSIEYASELKLECAKVRGDLLSYKMEYQRVLKTRDVVDLEAGKQTYPKIQRLMLEAACKKENVLLQNERQTTIIYIKDAHPHILELKDNHHRTCIWEIVRMLANIVALSFDTKNTHRLVKGHERTFRQRTGLSSPIMAASRVAFYAINARRLPLAPPVYTLVRASVINGRGFFEKQKLTEPNFIDWYRQLRIVLSIEDKLNYLEQPIPPVPVAPAGQHVAPEVLASHTTWIKGSKEIAGLMLMTMETEICQNLENLHAHEMLLELKNLFAHQAEQELLQTTRDFHSYKQEEGQSVSSYVLKMKGYIDNLERLGHPVTLGLGASLILIGLRKEYNGFVQNYNMYSMGKTVNELHAMLELHEQTLAKNNAPALHAI
nr:zinc finger, CCHC-type [Tanacetum cinerariifolium]